MDLFDDFDLDVNNNNNNETVKSKKIDLIESSSNNSNNYLNKKRTKHETNIINNIEKISNTKSEPITTTFDSNPDSIIESRLVGLIDNDALLSGSKDIKSIKKEDFDIEGCMHSLYKPKESIKICN